MNTSRWQQAQTYEADWWRSYAGTFSPQYLETYADTVTQAVAPVLIVGSATRAVEVGAGPVGIVAFINCGRRVATDPLDAAFEADPAYSVLRAEARANGTEYISAKGEALPLEDDAFDLYISDNVLDHVENPVRVLAEARRVLRSGGAAYIRVNVYHTWGRGIRWLMERAVVDKGHPHTFSSRSFIALAEEAGFEVIRSTCSSFLAGWKRDWSRAFSGSRKALIQAGLGITRANHELVLRAGSVQR